MLFNWLSNQQYFGALIFVWDASFSEYTFEPGKYHKRNIFLANRKRLAFESEEKLQHFISKEKIKR